MLVDNIKLDNNFKIHFDIIFNFLRCIVGVFKCFLNRQRVICQMLITRISSIQYVYD